MNPQWRLNSVHSERRHTMDMSGQLQVPAAMPLGKEPLVSIV
jgi:hypothetical protein